MNNKLIYPYTNMNQQLENPPFVVKSGKNIYVYDRCGMEYIDGVSSLYNVSLGYDNKDLISVAIEQFKKLPFYGSFNNQTNIEAIKLACKLSSIAPIRNAHVFFACSGSEANDTAVKFAWYYNNALNRSNKKIVLAFSNCYHGATIGAGSLTGPSSIHKDFDLPIRNIQHLPAPEDIYEGSCSSKTVDFAIQKMEKTILSISPDRIAAFILEPIFSCPGVFIPSSDYLRKLESLLRKYDILLIADEIVTSFFRSGSMFRSQEIGIHPDIITISKGLAASYQPISAVVISDKIFSVFLDHVREPDVFCHGFTYSAHPVAAAVANKAIEIYSKDSFKKNIELTCNIFKEKMLELYQFKFVKHVRQVGMIAGVEFDAQEIKAEQIVLMARKNGLLLRSAGNTVILAPPLIISLAQIDEVFFRLRNTIKTLSRSSLNNK
ncbi:MAG: aminotransferase class III-fold pyridoxal phosphate-dependent enzyme [Myxococcaceae bacterium]